MIKKTLCFCLILTIYFLLKGQNISAKETCYFFVNNDFHSSIDLPFYYHELTRETSTSSSMPQFSYKKSTTIIDSLTKCESIKKTIINSTLIANKLEFAHYTKTIPQTSEEDFFWEAKFKQNNAVVTGQGKRFDEEAPELLGINSQYISNIDNPIDLEHLITTFSAYDNFDGNISHNIKIEHDDYSSNTTKMGEYLVIISSEDSSKNKISCPFYIKVIDTTPPIISGKNEFTSYLSAPINIDYIKKSLTISDNSNIDLSSQIFVCDDTYSSNKNLIGKHKLYFCAYDYSNNLSNNFLVEVTVEDDIPPIIEGLDYYASYMSSPLTIQEILYSVAASDNNKDISSSIFITRDLYSKFQSTPGEKQIYIQAMDEYQNTSKEFKITINLIDDIPPQIFGLNIYDSYLSSPISLSHIKQQLSVIDNVDGNITSKIEITNDSYTNSINKKGLFYITFIAKDSSKNTSEDFRISINNIDDVKPYFYGPENLIYQVNEKPPLDVILEQYTAIDNNDNEIGFEILSDTYSDSIKTGDFFISLSCTDSSANKSMPFSIKVTVVEELIKTNEITLYLPTSTFLTNEEITSLLNLSSSYILLENTYSENYSFEGTYTIKYKLPNNDLLEVSITTFNVENSEEIPTQETKKETLITKIKRFFQKIFDFFKNLFNCIILKDFRFFL